MSTMSEYGGLGSLWEKMVIYPDSAVARKI